jgi:peptidoglycan/xylan/chitin deacetylase (PgdA/CDA1 family)
MRAILKMAIGLLLAAAPAWADEQPRPPQDARTQQAHHPEERVALFQRGTIFHSGLTHSHTIALTFDDGPNAHTAEVLDALKDLHVKATFFIVGNQAHRHPGILARIAREGHLLANHSATHRYLGASYDADPARLIEEVRDVDAQIVPLMQPHEQRFFRAPYGAWKHAHAAILNDDPQLRDYIGPIYWDVGGDIRMSRDGYVMGAADWECWRLKWSAHTCAKGYTREIRRKDGGVVLMHCIHVNSAVLVREVVPPLIEEGYRFVRLDEIPEYRRYRTPPRPLSRRPRGVADARPPKAQASPVRLSALKPETASEYVN